MTAILDIPAAWIVILAPLAAALILHVLLSLVIQIVCLPLRMLTWCTGCGPGTGTGGSPV